VIRNHSVLYVDLMGTCFDILTKPIPLQQRHIDGYRHKVIMGNHKKAVAKEDILANYLSTDKSGVSGILGSSKGVLMADGADLEMPIDDPSQVVLHKEMLHSSVSDTRDVKFSAENIDFGFTERGRLSEGRQFTLQNKYSFPVKVDWHLLDVLDKTSGKVVKNPFRVVPACAEISANSTATFNAEFAPYEPDSYFFQIAQAFITMMNGSCLKTKKLLAATNMTTRSSRTAKTLLGSIKQKIFEDFDDIAIDPPIAMNIRLCGHSFAPGSQPFIPMIKMS